MKVLLSGFTPFGDNSENSSQLIVESLNGIQLPSIEIKTCILPVVFSSVFDHLKIEMESFKPDVVICLGLAEKRKVISLEKIAHNHIHCTIPDNEGKLIHESKISSDGPDSYPSTLPITEWIALKTPHPLEISLSAGSYVCNYLMYKVLEHTKNQNIRAGFIHLPPIENNLDDIKYSLLTLIRSL